MPVPDTTRRLPRTLAAVGVLALVGLGAPLASAANSDAGLPNPSVAGAPVADSTTGGVLGEDLDGATDGTGAPDPAAVAQATEQLAASDPNDLWAVAEAAALPLDGLWSPTQGAYVANSIYVAERFPRGRMNAEMLLMHAYAVEGGRPDEMAHPERIEPLVRLLTGPMYVESWDGKKTTKAQDGRSTTVHSPGFTDATRDPVTMHQALDAVVLRALAAAWRVRDEVELSEAARALIQDRVTSVARSPYWRFPGRLLNQINWNADVYAADAEVSGDPTLLREDYRKQLIWFAERADRNAYPNGAPNLTSGLGFHYAPHRKPDNRLNRSDTAEYASLALGALAYHDQARAAGMRALPASTQTTMRRWMRRVAYGNWTPSGYLNWDSGKGAQRLHLTQYWVLALRGFATGLEGSKNAAFMVDQKATARATSLAAFRLYRQRVVTAKSVILPAANYGFAGGALVAENYDGLTGTARFASTAAELAVRGLDRSTGRPVSLPNAYAHDSDIGRLAVTTSRFSTAFVLPWTSLHVGGLEPARLLDAKARPLTSIGGSEDGTLGLRIEARGATQISTQPGRPRRNQPALRVSGGVRDHSGRLRGTLVASGEDAGYKVGLRLQHRIQASRIRTTYRVRVDRSDRVTGVLRIPTYGKGVGSLRRGTTYSRAALLRTLRITSPNGGRFDVRWEGLPAGARGRVTGVKSQRGNPTPGAQLRIEFPLPKGRYAIARTITVPAVAATP